MREGICGRLVSFCDVTDRRISSPEGVRASDEGVSASSLGGMPFWRAAALLCLGPWVTGVSGGVRGWRAQTASHRVNDEMCEGSNVEKGLGLCCRERLVGAWAETSSGGDGGDRRDGQESFQLESLILAQNERWRQA